MDPIVEVATIIYAFLARKPEATRASLSDLMAPYTGGFTQAKLTATLRKHADVVGKRLGLAITYSPAIQTRGGSSGTAFPATVSWAPALCDRCNARQGWRWNGEGGWLLLCGACKVHISANA